ncbi:MAG: hypothetical protein AB7E79_08835 [Rhodospirillaceae bacterium]
MDTGLVNTFLLLVLLPAWLVAGLIDWWCHRISRIEDTVGPKESILHLVLSAQAAVAIVPALFLEINAAIIALMIVMFVAHELSTNLDVHMAVPARAFTTLEVRTHNFLTAIPLAGLLLVMATHTDQSAALFGLGDSSADFSLRWKDPALPAGYVIAWFGASFLFNIAPFTEELLRSLRRARERG